MKIVIAKIENVIAKIGKIVAVPFHTIILEWSCKINFRGKLK
jgi:hypothetical protein